MTAPAKETVRIGITGSYGGMNLGDEAILQSIIAQIRKDLPAEITVFSRDAEDTKKRHQVERAVPVRKLSRAEVAPEIERLDLLLVGGGGILFDAEARIYLANVLYDRGDYEAALYHLDRTAPEEHWYELGIWRLVEAHISEPISPDSLPQ